MSAIRLPKLSDEFDDAETRAFLLSVEDAIRELPKVRRDNGADARYKEVVGALPRSFRSSDLTKDLLAGILSSPEGRIDSLRLLVLVMLRSALASGFCTDHDLLWFSPRLDAILEGTARPAGLVCEVILSSVPCRQHVLLRLSNSKASPSLGRSHYVSAYPTDVASEALAEALEELSANTDCKRLSRGGDRVYREFSASLGGMAPADRFGLGAETLMRQLSYFEGCDHPTRLLISLYRRCAEQMPESRPMFSPGDGITRDFLCNRKFLSLLNRGYRAVLKNPDDPVPAWDKWHLYPNGSERKGAEEKPNVGVCVDAALGDPLLKQALKEWLWESDASLGTIADMAESVRLVLNPVIDKAPAILEGGTKKVVVTLGPLSRSLADLSRRGLAPDTCYTKRITAYDFLLFAEARGAVSIEGACHLLLGRGHQQKSIPHDIEVADKGDIAKLRGRFAEDAGASLERDLCGIVFRLTCILPERISKILDIKTSSVVEIGRTGLYKLEEQSKTTGHAKLGLQLPPEAKRLIDEAIALTEPLRAEAPQALKPYVFLLEGWRGKPYVMNRDVYNKNLWRVCDELGIDRISTQNIRKTRKTDARLLAEREGLSQAELKAVSPGTRAVDDAHYFRPSTREYLLAVSGIEIGTEKVSGRVEDACRVGDDANLVEGGCGWCGKDECKVQGMLTCLRCGGFWSTPAHIPEFKGMIEMADRRLATCELEHERTSILAVKREAARWLAALLEKQADEERGRDATI